MEPRLNVQPVVVDTVRTSFDPLSVIVTTTTPLPPKLWSLLSLLHVLHIDETRSFSENVTVTESFFGSTLPTVPLLPFASVRAVGVGGVASMVKVFAELVPVFPWVVIPLLVRPSGP